MSLSFTVPVRVVVAPVGGLWKSSAGKASPPSTTPAYQPMPRLAKTVQMMSAFLPPLATRSACTIALRMSSMVGSAGDSSIARVMMLIA